MFLVNAVVDKLVMFLVNAVVDMSDVSGQTSMDAACSVSGISTLGRWSLSTQGR